MRYLIVLLLTIALYSCRMAAYSTFYVNKRFDGKVEYLFLKRNKCINVTTDTLVYRRGQAVTLRQIRRLDDK